MSVALNIKANIAIGIALAALAGMGWLSLRESRNLAQADHWVAHTHDVLEASASLRSHLSDAGIARRLFLQGDRAQAEFSKAAASAALADLDRLRSLTTDNAEQQKKVDRLELIVRERLALIDKSTASHLENENDQEIQQHFTEQLTGSAAQFASQAHEFESIEKAFLQLRSMRVEESMRSTSRTDAVLALSVFCFIIIATAVLNGEWARRKQIEQTIAEQKSLLQSILDTCNDAVVVADSSGNIILRNPAASRLYSNHPERLTDDLPERLGLYKPDEKTLLSCQELPLWRALSGEHVDNLEVCVRPPHHELVRWSLASSGPLVGDDGKTQGGVVFVRDISDRKELEKKLAKYAEELRRSNEELLKAQGALERLASIDELTGLHNRRGFLALAEQSVKVARRARKPFALVFADLDRMKNINDTFGHTEGDHAIGDAALMLRDSFRHCDVLGRLGGDEFAILMMDACKESAEVVRKRLAEKIDRFNARMKRPYQLSLSVGMVMCDFDEKLPLEVLLEKADAMMYEEKRRKGVDRRAKVQCAYSDPHACAGIGAEQPS